MSELGATSCLAWRIDQRRYAVPLAEVERAVRMVTITSMPAAPAHVQGLIDVAGQAIPVVVTEVTDESITLDGNHPLAGQDLTFDLELVEIV